jgi:hypothetical protein
MMFAILLILLAVAGLVLDERDALPANGYGWVPGASVACLVIGGVLLLRRLGEGGSRGFGFGLAGFGVAGLLTERSMAWAPASLHGAVVIAGWVAIALGIVIWVFGMWQEHEATGLGIALGLVAVGSLVADTASDLPSPWDGLLNVVTAGCFAGALCAGLAALGGAFEDDDLLAMAYLWLTSAVVGGLGLSVTAIVAAASFDEPAWVFALLICAVAVGLLGAGAALFMGLRALNRHRHEFDALQELQAREAVRERYAEPDDDDELPWFDDEELAQLDDEELAPLARPRARTSAGRRVRPDPEPEREPDPGPKRRQRGLRKIPAVLGITADLIAIGGVIFAAVQFLAR